MNNEKNLEVNAEEKEILTEKSIDEKQQVVEENLPEANSEEQEEKLSVDKIEEKEENLSVDSIVEEEELTMKVTKPKRGFSNFLKASLIDTLFIFVVSLITLFVFDLILRTALGFYVVDLISMLVIFIFVIAIIYPAIMHSKKGMTLGQKFSKLKIAKVD